MSGRAQVIVAKLRHYRVRPIVLVTTVTHGPKTVIGRSVHVPLSRAEVANLARTYDMITFEEHARQVKLSQVERDATG